jgi:hypothetical protein
MSRFNEIEREITKLTKKNDELEEQVEFFLKKEITR